MSDKYESRARLFRVLGHPARLQILDILAVKPCCVCTITEQIGCRQPYASQQLAVLREAGLIIAEREGLNVRYRLASPDVQHLIQRETNLMTNKTSPRVRENDT
jgi:DNA-binding transcriptional ArsR family regulator